MVADIGVLGKLVEGADAPPFSQTAQILKGLDDG
jgi:hypothetical protein